MDELVEQVTDALKSNLSKYTQSLKDRIASLETQLQEKDMLIAHVQVSLASLAICIQYTSYILEL